MRKKCRKSRTSRSEGNMLLKLCLKCTAANGTSDGSAAGSISADAIVGSSISGTESGIRALMYTVKCFLVCGMGVNACAAFSVTV